MSNESMKQVLKDIVKIPTLTHGVLVKLSDVEQAIAEAEKQEPMACHHRIVDITNPVIKSGYMCMDCGALFGAYTEKEKP